ncbi:MAG: glycosyltransferase family 2 protein, partial [Betaproteobacteria bacterium]|nr:glycosyltransferase family 2 protein [Betaproteobacteria bacterium]
MTAPTFSVLIPTRERPATFRHTLASVAGQPADDYEIVVADNCSGPETRRIVEALAFPRLRYIRSDEVLPMAENWERGLAQCNGEYVTVLGDDDGFLLTTLDLARMMISVSQPEIICWETHVYWWPDTIVPWLRNMLRVTVGSRIQEVSSRRALERFYRGELTFGQLPMIYNAFFHHDILDEARRRYDAFFVPVDTSPDIASGILGLHLTDRHVYSMRPLSIRGNSGNSIGTAHWARPFGAERRDSYIREERLGLEGIIHPALVPSPNLHVHIASSKLKCRDLYFPDDPALEVNLHHVLRDMTATLNDWPEAYEENLEDIEKLAAKLQVRLDPKALQERSVVDRSRMWGPQLDLPMPALLIDAELAGIRDI